MFRRTNHGAGGALRPWIGLAAAGGLMVALAPGAAQAAPAMPAQAAPQMLQQPVSTRSVTATVHFASGKSYLTAYSQRILVGLLRSIPAGATVTSTTVVGYVQARTAWDNGRALGTARAVEVRTHLKALGLKGRFVVSSGGIYGNSALSRRAVVTITYTVARTLAQTIDFTRPEGMTMGDTDMPLTATATSGLGVTVRSTTTSVCQVVGSVGAWQLHAVDAGECDLVATQPGNGVFRAAAPVTRAVTIDPQHSNPPAPTSYDVAYDAQGGSVSPTTTSWTEGDDALVLPTPTLDGFTFDGWFAAADGGTAVGDAGDDFTPSDDATLYAHWTEVSSAHTVTFHANYTDGPSDTTQESESAAALTANPFGATQNGLSFAGWATEPGGAVVYADGATYDFAANEDLYAVWGFRVSIFNGFSRSSFDVSYCGRADGHCGTEVALTTVAADSGITTILVFPNQDAGGVLGGFEVSLTPPGGWADTDGSVSVDPAQSQTPWTFNGQGAARFDVTGNGHIHLDFA